jgi:basic membrane protein A
LDIRLSVLEKERKMSKDRLIILIVSLVVLVAMIGGCAPAEAPDTGPKAAFIISEPLGDPFTDMSVKGIQKAMTEVQGDFKIIEAQSSSEYQSQIRSLAELGYDPIIVVWDDLADAAAQLAPDFPDTHFILYDAFIADPELPNVQFVWVDSAPACYIAGIVAANLTETGNVAAVFGADLPFLIGGFFAPWEAGIKSVNPDINISSANAGTWLDPNVGRELALQLAAEDNDVIFDMANKTGLGVIEGAVEGDYIVFSTDLWKGDLSPNLLWSSLKPGDEALYIAVMDIYNGNFEPGIFLYGPADGASLYDMRDFNKLDPDVQKLVEEAAADLHAGKIDLPTDTDTR